MEQCSQIFYAVIGRRNDEAIDGWITFIIDYNSFRLHPKYLINFEIIIISAINKNNKAYLFIVLLLFLSFDNNTYPQPIIAITGIKNIFSISEVVILKDLKNKPLK